MPSRRINNFPESRRGLGHVTLTIFGSTVGYPSDSLASCFTYLLTYTGHKRIRLQHYMRLKFMADFHSKMSVCRHELGGGFNPPRTIPTLYISAHYARASYYPLFFLRILRYILRKQH